MIISKKRNFVLGGKKPDNMCGWYFCLYFQSLSLISDLCKIRDQCKKALCDGFDL